MAAILNTSKRKQQQNGQRREITSLADCTCPICMSILIEPVTLPCDHELCMPCYQEHVSKANLVCPLCRTRLSVWARRAARHNSLVNQARWHDIRRAYPQHVQNRLDGNDDDDDLIGDSEPVFIPRLAEPGELRKEYEEERDKVTEERREQEQREEEASRELIERLQKQATDEEEEAQRERVKQQEEEASRALIEKLQKELEEEEERVRRAQREQEEKDLLLAAQLSKEINKKSQDPTHSWSSPSTRNSRSGSGKNSDRNLSKRHSSSKLPSTSSSSSHSASGSGSAEPRQGHLKLWYQTKPKQDNLSSTEVSQTLKDKASGDNRYVNNNKQDLPNVVASPSTSKSPWGPFRQKRPSENEETSTTLIKRHCLHELENTMD